MALQRQESRASCQLQRCWGFFIVYSVLFIPFLPWKKGKKRGKKHTPARQSATTPNNGPQPPRN